MLSGWRLRGDVALEEREREREREVAVRGADRSRRDDD
jgi:hypothetical protein